MLSVYPIVAIAALIGGDQPPATPALPPAAAPATPAPVTPAPAASAATPEDIPDYPKAIMTPASTANYKPANRPLDTPINMVVIHDIEGTAISTVHWFQNPKARVTSHYIVGGDGTIYQSVKEHNVAWHAGNRDVNGSAIGIEHEGYAYRPGFYNPAEYEASAALVRSITTRYSIPRDRTHIIGHFEVPDLVHPGKFGGSGGHTDPGPWWDWDSYMTLVRSDARLGAVSLPTEIHPGEDIAGSITLTNVGDDPWPTTSKATGADRGSESADAIGRRAQGLVYLGMWSPETAPIPSTSVFFGKGWVSPRFVAPVANDIANGSDATFSFTLHGPRALGPVAEQFRLFKLPTAPHMPVGFGPEIAANIEVKPWDIVVDQTAGPDKFSANGWSLKPAVGTIPPIYYVAGQKPKAGAAAASPISPASWQSPLPISGDWDVYVQWAPGQARTTTASYTVNGLPSKVRVPVLDALISSKTTLPVDQRVSAGAWHFLARFHFDGKTPAQVSLAPDTAPGTVVVAGSARFVGPFPAPPGSPEAAPAPITNGPGPRP